jgi:hypothetical protein
VTRTRVWLITAAVLLGGCVVAVLVWLRTMCRPGYVPQLDAPLWHGTDLPAPTHTTASESLAGAILQLAYATDETSARYWLAVAARRGATWEQCRELWDGWQQLAADTVQTMHTDPKDSQ